jgi:hypothetical protein
MPMKKTHFTPLKPINEDKRYRSNSKDSNSSHLKNRNKSPSAYQLTENVNRMVERMMDDDKRRKTIRLEIEQKKKL